MKKLFTLMLWLTVATLSAQTVAITFQVDMSGETISPDGVHLVGNLNAWTTDATPLSLQGNSIYTVTLDLTPGNDYEYKFLNGKDWGTEEAAPANCTVGGNNRIFTAPVNELVLPVVPFNGCPAEVPTQMVTFQVDMSGQSISPNGVHVAGNFNGWQPGATQMTTTSNNIYQVTVPVLSSITILQYKYINNNDWGAEEDPPDECANGSNNRVFLLENAGMEVSLPLEAFGGCANALPTKPVTFRVDLNGAAASADGVHLAGDFQGWQPGNTRMTNVEGDLYEVTVDIPVVTTSIQYKYVNGNNWGFEEDPPDECANADNNRVAALPISTDAITLPTYQFGTCDALTGTEDLLPAEYLMVYPQPAQDILQLRWTAALLQGDYQVLLHNLQGQILQQHRGRHLATDQAITLDLSALQRGIYLVQVRTADGIIAKKIVKQ